MKKGFTIIEIIISISLLLIIGISTIFLYSKNNKSLNEITKSILEAANLYIKTEVDEKGNIYINKVKSGNKGVKIPLSNLVNKGYIEDSVQKKVIELSNKGNNYNYYVMLLNGNGETEKDYCDDNAIVSIASWIDEDKDKDIYLCNYNDNKDNNGIYNKIINMNYHTQCAENTSTGLCLLKAHEELVDANSDGSLNDVYYFRGNVDNNYLKFKDVNRIFRIVRTTENSDIKIVENDSINSIVLVANSSVSKFTTNTLGEVITSDRSGHVSHILMDGFKIKMFKQERSGLHYNDFLCEDENNTSSFSDDKLVTCKYEDKEIQIQSPLYTAIYKPLIDNYTIISENLSKYINESYKWCLSSTKNENMISNISFKCNEEKQTIGEVGLLNIFEYSAIQFVNEISYDRHKQYIYDNYIGHWGCDEGLELSFATTPIPVTISLNPYPPASTGGCTHGEEIKKIRPTYVIYGNSKIIQGDGTKENPFIIDGFV